MEDNIYGGGYYAKPHDANPGAYLDVYNPQGQVITPEQFKSTGLNVTQLPSAPQNIPTTDVSLGNPTITSDMLKTPTTSFDIQGLLRENQKIREKYLSSLTPSSQEQDLGVQIADIQNKIRQQDLSFQRGSEDIAQQRISMPLITGQQAALGRQAQLEQQQLSIQESNLLTRLGLAQEARTAQQKVLETGMSFIAQDIELQGKIQDRISAEQDRILQRAATMSTLQKNTLSQLAQAFQAYTPEQLVQFQPQIAQIASQAGIPIDLALATIHSASDEYAFGKMLKESDVNQQKFSQDLALKKFEEDKRQFGLNYALAQQKAAGTLGAIPGGTVTNDTGVTFEYGTPEYVIERLKQTGASKTKPVASEREQLGKFANVVALTDNLMNSLDKTTNDPIIGYLRSLNPYDFDARAVNAQVTALVPSVARALYGEVGVLTDTDIERYLKTLPNIKSTTDQNRFIAAMTLSNARRAYEQTLLNLANSNVNVSGFADSYKNLTEKLNELDVKISDVKVEPADVKEFESVVSQPEGYWSNLWGALFGK